MRVAKIPPFFARRATTFVWASASRSGVAATDRIESGFWQVASKGRLMKSGRAAAVRQTDTRSRAARWDPSVSAVGRHQAAKKLVLAPLR